MTGERPRPGTWRGSVWSTMRTEARAGDSTCPCWSWRWRKTPTTTATCITWGGSIFSTGGGRRALPCSSGIWPCRQPLGRMNGVPPCACWRRIILPWRWRERRNGGFSGRLARHPISGSPGWTWRTWPTTKRTGTVCFGPQAGPWPSPSGPEPTSVRRPPGESIPGGGPESAGPGAG